MHKILITELNVKEMNVLILGEWAFCIKWPHGTKFAKLESKLYTHWDIQNKKRPSLNRP